MVGLDLEDEQPYVTALTNNGAELYLGLNVEDDTTSNLRHQIVRILENGQISSSYGEDICENSLQEIRAMAYMTQDILVSTLADAYVILSSQDLDQNKVYQAFEPVSGTPFTADTNMDALLVDGSVAYLGFGYTDAHGVMKLNVDYTAGVISMSVTWLKWFQNNALVLAPDDYSFPTDLVLGTFDTAAIYVFSSHATTLGYSSFVKPLSISTGADQGETLFLHGLLSTANPKGGQLATYSTGLAEKIISCVNYYDEFNVISHVVFMSDEKYSGLPWSTPNLKYLLPVGSDDHMCVGIKVVS